MHSHAFPFIGWVATGSSVRTKDMELLTLSVLYLPGYDAGQKYIQI